MTDRLAAWYDHNVPDARERLKLAKEALDDALPKNPDIVFVSGRVKDRHSFVEKAIRKRYESPETEIQDLVGVRVVVRRRHKVTFARSIVHELAESRGWQILVEEDRGREVENLSVPGYQATHLVLQTDPGDPGSTVEVQVMTILQSAWAALQHDLVYKGAADPKHARRATALAGLLELAEKEFDELRLSMSGGLEQLPDELTTSFDVELLVKAVCDLPQDETTEGHVSDWADALLQVIRELGLTKRHDLVDTLGDATARENEVAQMQEIWPWMNGFLITDMLLRLRVPGYFDRRSGIKSEDSRTAFEEELASFRAYAGERATDS